MKKILIATTALVATAGVAAAEVSINGNARFGMIWQEGAAAVPGTAAVAAVQGVHTAASAAAVNADLGLVVGVDALAAGDAVTTEHYLSLTDLATLAGGAVTAAVEGAGGFIDTRSAGTFTTQAEIDAARAAAVAAQDAAVIAALDTLETNVASDAATLAAAAADAAALLTAAAGVPAIAATAGTPAGEDTTGVASRLRIQFAASTTTDAGVGLSFFQRFQTDENRASNNGNGARFGLTYGNFAMNVGNIVGVIESTPNLYMNTTSAGVGLEGNGFSSLVLSNWTAYSSAGAGATDGVEVIYSANGLRLHAHDTATATAYGASFAMGDITVAAAYEDFDAGGSATLLTAGMNLGMGWVAVSHGTQESAAGVDVTQTALKGGYDVAPGMNVYGFVKSADAGDAAGIGMSYDLGGSASFEAGYTNTSADLGILSAGVFFTF